MELQENLNEKQFDFDSAAPGAANGAAGAGFGTGWEDDLEMMLLKGMKKKAQRCARCAGRWNPRTVLQRSTALAARHVQLALPVLCARLPSPPPPPPPSVLAVAAFQKNLLGKAWTAARTLSVRANDPGSAGG